MDEWIVKLSLSPHVQLDTSEIANRALGICQLEAESNLPACDTKNTLKLARDLSYGGTYLNALNRAFAACDAEQRSSTASATRASPSDGSSVFQSDNRFEGLAPFEREFALWIEDLYEKQFMNWLEVFRDIDEIYDSADGMFGFNEDEFWNELYIRLSGLPFENCTRGDDVAWGCSAQFTKARRELMSGKALVS